MDDETLAISFRENEATRAEKFLGHFGRITFWTVTHRHTDTHTTSFWHATRQPTVFRIDSLSVDDIITIDAIKFKIPIRPYFVVALLVPSAGYDDET